MSLYQKYDKERYMSITSMYNRRITMLQHESYEGTLTREITTMRVIGKVRTGDVLVLLLEFTHKHGCVADPPSLGGA